MLDASFERRIIRCAHDHVDIAWIVVDQRLAQRRAIGDRRRQSPPSFGGNSTAAWPGFRPRPALAATHARSSLLRTAD